MGDYSQRRNYNKVVRDRIPEYLEKKGIPHTFHIATATEYKKKLLEKFSEEAQEIAEAKTKKELIEELADLEELLAAVRMAYGIDKKEITASQKIKRKERGGYEKRIILDWS